MRKQTKDALEHLAQAMVDSDSYISLRGTAKFIEWALRLHKQSGSYVTAQTIRLHEKDLEEMCQAEMLKRNPLNKGIIVPKQFDDDVDSDFEDDEYDVFEDEEFYWASGDMVDHDTVIRRALELIKNKMDEEDKKFLDEDDTFFTSENIKDAQEEFLKEHGDMIDLEPRKPKFEIEKQKSMNQQISDLVIKMPDYTMFSVGEDGLRVLRGNYKGLYIREIDHLQWEGCAAGWSRKMLKDNELLGPDRKGALTEDDKNAFLDIISGKDV